MGSNNKSTKIPQPNVVVRTDDGIKHQRGRLRTYSIESLFDHGDSYAESSQWRYEDPMWWNENVYIEIDTEEDCGSGDPSTTKPKDISDDIFSLFPFPLSIASPPLPDAKTGINATDNNATAVFTGDESASGASNDNHVMPGSIVISTNANSNEDFNDVDSKLIDQSGVEL